jgi:hypothetical protein
LYFTYKRNKDIWRQERQEGREKVEMKERKREKCAEVEMMQVGMDSRRDRNKRRKT